MKLCIFGAGAIGGHLAAKLAAAGHATSVVARGVHLEAMRRAGGLRLHIGERELFGPVRASASAAELGAQDVVIVTTKATALPEFAADVAPLLGADTAVVFVQNGIPWWYALGLTPGRPRPPDLSRLDPGGVLGRAIDAFDRNRSLEAFEDDGGETFLPTRHPFRPGEGRKSGAGISEAGKLVATGAVVTEDSRAVL